MSSARCTPNAVPSCSFGVLNEIIASRGAVRIPLPARSRRITPSSAPQALPTAINAGLQNAEIP